MPSIIILGLGPGGWDLLTLEARDVLATAGEVYLRTSIHPTVPALREHLPDLRLESFDSYYERNASFADVYRDISERVLELAMRPQGVVYAVPGHPLIAETTVQLIRAAALERAIPLRIVAGLSFIEPICTTLGIDPVDNGTQLLDAALFAGTYNPQGDPPEVASFPGVAPRSIDPLRPALFAQVYNQRLATAVKLALLNYYPAEHTVTLVSAAGTGDRQQEQEATLQVPLYKIDHPGTASKINHLSTLYVPALPVLSATRILESFRYVIARLRAPGGCPWDREQTHASLRPYLLEETYEALAALDEGDMDAFAEELGDILLQIVLHAQLATEVDEFTLDDVIESIMSKIIYRHPHVFGDVQVADAEAVLRNWEALKKRERAGRPQKEQTIMGTIPITLPALAYAEKMGQRAAKVGFEWPAIEGSLAKVHEEIEEIREAPTAEERANEWGDLLFALVQVGRKLGINSEEAVRAANTRFRRRFEHLEHEAAGRNVDLRSLSIDELLAMWERAKEQEA